jgi:hypothetical protein
MMALPRIISDEPSTADQWDSAWSLTAHATYFESRQWAEAWARATSDRLRPAARRVTFEDGVVAIVPGSDDVRAGGLLRIRRMSPADTYGGWLADEPLSGAHAESLARFVPSKGSIRWLVNPFLQLGHELPVEGDGATWTSALDLSGGYVACRAGWSKGHRSAANQAERSGVVVRAASTPADWRMYYEVYERSIARWGNAATSRYPEALFNELAADPVHVRLWLAIVDGGVVAGALCLHGPRIVNYWHGAADDRSFALRPTNLVLQEVIRTASIEGFRWLDLGPSGGHQGVERFKHGFGPMRLDVSVVDRSAAVVGLVRSARRARRSTPPRRPAVE